LRPGHIVYPHRKPALVLTPADVSRAELTEHFLAGAPRFLVTLNLKETACEKLAATVEGDHSRWLTVTIDHKNWGVHRYEPDQQKPFVPEQARATTIRTDVGFFSSREEAQRLVKVLD
jgi:hypothetical protein